LSGMESEPVEASAGETSVEEAPSEELPSWLAGLEEETEQPGPAAGSQDELPEWLRMEDEESPAEPEPTTPTDWQPADKAKEPPAPKAEEKPAPEPPTSTPVESKPEPSAPPEREAYREPVTRSRSGMTGMLSMAKDPALTAAQNELTRGNIPGAIDSYGKLIKKGKLLDEIIFDLREALYRYPVEVAILQALGDAYMRANRLQEALDSYTKAEELLR
jgi:tetratricopeptide (TPR) repeat protein